MPEILLTSLLFCIHLCNYLISGARRRFRVWLCLADLCSRKHQQHFNLHKTSVNRSKFKTCIDNTSTVWLRCINWTNYAVLISGFHPASLLSVTFINQLMHSIITVIEVKILLYKSLWKTHIKNYSNMFRIT